MSRVNTYWRKREEEALKHYITEEREYDKRIKEIYRNMLDECQSEIDRFYGRYAKQEKITINEAKKRVARLDIAEYERKAAKYVKERDFSDTANKEMRLYNATMKINRLEMLKANIGMYLISGHDEMERFMEGILKGRTEEELKRQAGILGDTVRDNAKAADVIVNASFHNAAFSDRIWQNQRLLHNRLDSLLQTGMIQGKNGRQLGRELRKTFDVGRYESERLMRTELARVQIEAQKQSLIENGFEHYEFIANSKCCDACQTLDGKHFKVKDMMIGENAPPVHPNCRCSIAAWEDDEEYEAWLDYLSKGGTTEEWNRLKNAGKSVANQRKSGIMKLPRHEEAVIPMAKLTQYALNPDKSPDKAIAFEKALGYTMDNADELIAQIRKNLPKYNAVEKGDKGWGKRYEVVMNIIGPNGKNAKVLTAWIVDKKTNELRMTSVYIDKE